MFGVGPDAGQTTIRLRHAYGQWRQIGAGQTNSQFMLTTFQASRRCAANGVDIIVLSLMTYVSCHTTAAGERVACLM